VKKGLIVLLVVMLTIASIVGARVGSIDDECQAECGPDYYGIVKFEWDNGGFEPENPALFGYEITIEGDDEEAEWESDPNVHCVIVKAGQEEEQQTELECPGDDEGTVVGIEGFNPKGKPITKGISHVTFCKYYKNGGGNDPPNGVPEFSTMTLAAAIIIGSLGVAFLRKR